MSCLVPFESLCCASDVGRCLTVIINRLSSWLLKVGQCVCQEGGLCAQGVVMSGRRMKWSVFDDIVVVE